MAVDHALHRGEAHAGALELMRCVQALQLGLASNAAPVELDAFERSLYGTLVRRVRDSGQPIAPELLELATAPAAAWVDEIWLTDQ